MPGAAGYRKMEIVVNRNFNSKNAVIYSGKAGGKPVDFPCISSLESHKIQRSFLCIIYKKERFFMRKLALSDEILLKIEKPARYIGNEINSVMKDKEKVAIRFAMCFPDCYEIGESHLGMKILYDMFNRREDTWCERVYSPWTDLDRIMREERIPLFALESQDPVREFDFLGITIQYEMCYTNILQVLDLSGIPLFSKDRTEEDPIVIGGGPCAVNPEPLADFLTFFTLERARPFMMSFWMPIRKTRKRTEQEKNFWRWQRRSKESMFHSFMMPNTMRMEH